METQEKLEAVRWLARVRWHLEVRWFNSRSTAERVSAEDAFSLMRGARYALRHNLPAIPDNWAEREAVFAQQVREMHLSAVAGR